MCDSHTQACDRKNTKSTETLVMPDIIDAWIDLYRKWWNEMESANWKSSDGDKWTSLDLYNLKIMSVITQTIYIYTAIILCYLANTHEYVENI